MEILFLGKGEDTALNIIWEIRLPRILAAIILGGALSVSGFLLQTFFRKSHSQSLCSWNFIRSKAGRFPCDDLPSGKIHGCLLGSSDSGRLCGLHDLHGLCAACCEKSKTDVSSYYQRYYDRIYLFCQLRIL